MENSGCRWDKQEDIQLTKLFKTYSMDIHEIAQIHRRSLESIRLRLIKFGLIQENNTSKQVSKSYFFDILNVSLSHKLISINCPDT